MKVSITLLFLFLSLFSRAADPVSHEIWEELLKKHVSPKGNVNYKGFIKDQNKLKEYCDLLSEKMPESSWTSDQKKAFWINAYNAFTVKLVVVNYPVKSIKDIGRFIDPWKIKFIKIGGVTMDLNHIEHKILRKDYNDPRIHFGINCASYSCPRLINKAFTAENVNSLLEELAVEFVNDPTKNKITAGKVEISEIFKWFKEDFTKKGTIIDFLNKYSKTTINSNASVTYMKYNWSLNE